MKKIILGSLAVGMCLALAACGTTTNADAAVSTLSNQLDHTANIISNVQTVSPTQITAENMSEFASYNSSNAQNSFTSEEYYKLGILNKTALIKNHLSGLKLSKAQQSAVRDLTEDLAQYTNSVSNSKTELSNTLRSIENLKRNYSKNEERINAKLSRLASNSNARLSYYQNILNTLSQLEQFIKTDTSTDTKTENPSNLGVKIVDLKDLENKESEEETTLENNKTTKASLQKNIDTYLPETKCPECGEKVNGKICPNCGKQLPIQNATKQINNSTLQPINNMPINNMPINNPAINPINNPMNMPINNGIYNYTNPANPYRFNSNNINHAAYPYGNGYYGGGNYGMYGINNGYYNAGIFNPNRNTDTYAPYMRNIDTYKGFGYGEENATFVNDEIENDKKKDVKVEEKQEEPEEVLQETVAQEEKTKEEAKVNVVEPENENRQPKLRRNVAKNVTRKAPPEEAKAHEKIHKFEEVENEKFS